MRRRHIPQRLSDWELFEREAAKERKKEGGKAGGKASGKLPEVSAGQTRDRIGKAVGVPGRLIARVVKVVENVPVHARASDRCVDATALCKAGGKKWAHYDSAREAQAYREELSRKVGTPAFDLIQKKRGHGGGTWVYPEVAIRLCMWISPQFATPCHRLDQHAVDRRARRTRDARTTGAGRASVPSSAL